MITKKQISTKISTKKRVNCCKCTIDIGLYSAACRIVTNSITYPLENYRLYYLLPDEKKPLRISFLYRGFPKYLPYTIFSTLFTYRLAYSINEILLFQSHYEKLVLSSILTCLITSMYKIPFNIYLKNSVLRNNVQLDKQFISKSIFISLIDDIMDLFVSTK
jgi:hypothetical protein